MKKTLAITLLLVLVATSAIAVASQFAVVNGSTIAFENFGHLGTLVVKNDGNEAAAAAQLAALYKINNLNGGPGGFGPAALKTVKGACVCFDDCDGEACHCYWCIAASEEAHAACTCAPESGG